VSQQPAFPVFCVEGLKVPYPASSFCQIQNWVREHRTTINVVEWEVTRQSSVRVTPLLYFFFDVHTEDCKSQFFWTFCDVHFEKQTSV